MAFLHWLKMAFGNVQPIDWLMLVVEVFVLGLIAWEIGHAIYDKWKVKRWIKAVHARFSEGQQLERDVPARMADEMAAQAWNASVQAWMQQTNTTLTGYSPQASAAFLHDRLEAGVRYRVHEMAHEWFVTLRSRLDNLRGIMEKPDVYM